MNYENFIHVVPNFRKISLPHTSQTTRTCTRARAHAHTHINSTVPVCDGIYLVFHISFPVGLLSSCQQLLYISTQTITIVLLQQHDVLCGSVCGIYCCFIVCYIFTPLCICTPLMCLSPCSPDPSPHKTVESQTVKWPTLNARHC
jgi:hypothetical protein